MRRLEINHKDTLVGGFGFGFKGSTRFRCKSCCLPNIQEINAALQPNCSNAVINLLVQTGTVIPFCINPLWTMLQILETRQLYDNTVFLYHCD